MKIRYQPEPQFDHGQWVNVDGYRRAFLWRTGRVWRAVAVTDKDGWMIDDRFASVRVIGEARNERSVKSLVRMHFNNDCLRSLPNDPVRFPSILRGCHACRWADGLLGHRAQWEYTHELIDTATPIPALNAS